MEKQTVKEEVKEAKSKSRVYCGPSNPAPLITIDGDPIKYRADELPERHIDFVVATVPEASGWWK